MWRTSIKALALVLLMAGGAWAQEAPKIGKLVMPSEYWGYVHEAAQKENVSPYILAGLMAIESRYDPKATSCRGRCIGLMQLDKGTARSLGVDPWNPRENIAGGARVIARLLRKHHGELRPAVREYNGTGYKPYADEVIKAVRQATRQAEEGMP